MSDEKAIDLSRLEGVHEAQRLLALFLFTQAMANAAPHSSMLADVWSSEISLAALRSVDAFSLRFERTEHGVRVTVARPGAARQPGEAIHRLQDEDLERDGPRG